MTPELPVVPPIAPSPPYKDRRGWLIALGIVEILIGCWNVLLVATVLITFLFLKAPFPNQPGAMSPAGVLTFTEVFYGGLAAFFITVGIGSIRCRNWARITMIVASTFWLVIGTFSIIVMAVVLPHLPMPAGATSGVRFQIVFRVMLVAAGFILVLVPAAFLIFYTRKSVRATCLARSPGRAAPGAAGVMSSTAPAPKLPVPVIILVAWEALGTCAFLGVLIHPAALLFGKLILGFPAVLIMLAYSLVAGMSAWLMYHREFAGWALATFKAGFSLVSGVASFWGRDWMQLYRDMGMNGQQLRIFEMFPRFMPALIVLSLVFVVGILAFLIYARKYFPRIKGETAA